MRKLFGITQFLLCIFLGSFASDKAFGVESVKIQYNYGASYSSLPSNCKKTNSLACSSIVTAGCSITCTCYDIGVLKRYSCVVPKFTRNGYKIDGLYTGENGTGSKMVLVDAGENAWEFTTTNTSTSFLLYTNWKELTNAPAGRCVIYQGAFPASDECGKGYYCPGGYFDKEESWPGNCVGRFSCESGKYSDTTTATSCKTCPVPFNKSEKNFNSGASSINQCYIEIDPGEMFYFSGTGPITQGSCPADSWCPGGHVNYAIPASAPLNLCPQYYRDNDDTGKSKESQCQIYIPLGSYVQTAKSSTSKCPNWTYNDVTKLLNYGSTSSCKNCPSSTSGWTKATGTGWDSLSDCAQTKTGSKISEFCEGGQLKQTASSSSSWGATTISIPLRALAGSIVSGQTCIQCTGATYSAGDTATKCTECPAQTSGWTRATGTGWDSYTDCTQTKSLENELEFCQSGTMTQTASSASRWGSTVYSDLTAKPGAYVTVPVKGAPETCLQCKGATYSAGGDVSECTECPAQTSGWTRATGTGWTSYTNCYQTKEATTMSPYCESGQLKRTAASSSHWGVPTISEKFLAKPGAYVFSDTGTTCNQCTGATYSEGGEATKCTECPEHYKDNTDAGKSSIENCQINVSAGSYIASVGGTPEECPNWTYNSYASSVNYGDTSVCTSCPEPLEGWSKQSGTGWTTFSQCAITKELEDELEFCQSGTMIKRPWLPNEWMPGVRYLNLSAKPGAIVSGNTTCTQCTGATYSAGDKATSCTECPVGYDDDLTDGKSAENQCKITVPAGSSVETNSSSIEICEAGTYSPGGSVAYGDSIACSSCSTYNSEFPLSEEGTANPENCYRNCTVLDIEHSTAIEGTITAGGINTCKATSCEEGYHLTEENTCEINTYTITLNKNGGKGTIFEEAETEDAIMTCTHGLNCSLPDGTEKLYLKDKNFVGWGLDETCQDGGVLEMVFDSAKTIYACWADDILSCIAGNIYQNGSFQECTPGLYCPGTGSIPASTSKGCFVNCPVDPSEVDIAISSASGASAATECYKQCNQKTTTPNGTLSAVNSKEYYSLVGGYPKCKYNVSCDEGYKAVDNGTALARCEQCRDGEYCAGGSTAPITCPAGAYCKAGLQFSCSDEDNGSYTMSDMGATDAAQCYKDCSLGLNATEMSGRDYLGMSDTCRIELCKGGFFLDDTTCETCPENNYCTGNSEINMCSSVGDGSWENSNPGSDAAQDCTKQCTPDKVVNGTAIPIRETEYYPKDCEYRGESDTGNPCMIIDRVCIESSCASNYEMINGICVKCNREFALSYKTTGNCIIDSCVAGYHTSDGRTCEPDVKECSVPNSLYAEQKWDFARNEFGPCEAKECQAGFHVLNNECISDEKVCTVENGEGVQYWDDVKNTWGKCEVMRCYPGYTNDPSETNELYKPCGECKNKYSALGEVAVSSYVRGCEIASCMYQGELYNLENNECVTICDINGYEDETGYMKWNPGRKKCERTCKEGYTMW